MSTKHERGYITYNGRQFWFECGDDIYLPAFEQFWNEFKENPGEFADSNGKKLVDLSAPGYILKTSSINYKTHRFTNLNNNRFIITLNS